MKSKITLYSALLATCLFAACSGNHHSSEGVDSAKGNPVNNPYRDTFKTTKTTGDATTLDNSGNGGISIARPVVQTGKPAPAPTPAPTDTVKK